MPRASLRSGLSRFVWLSATLVLLVSMSSRAQRLPASVTPPSVAPQPIPPEDASGYVGPERCESCHKPEFTEFHKTPHASLAAGKGTVQGCEVCHGPGRAHSEAEEAAKGDDEKMAAAAKLIFTFDGTAKENAGRCLTCHTTSESQSAFAHSEHFMHGVFCQDCHATHLVAAADEAAGVKTTRVGPAQPRIFNVPDAGVEAAWLQDSLLKKPQPSLCFTCHARIQSQFALPTHHPVPEGMMKCTDCHQPHGSMNPARLRNVRFEACVKCHVEKRGPFVFEHAAVQVEGCVACHTPHGGVTQMLLVRRETRFLCIQCHVAPSAPNTPHGRLGFQTSGNCTRCHVAIHGSNFDVNFLQ